MKIHCVQCGNNLHNGQTKFCSRVCFALFRKGKEQPLAWRQKRSIGMKKVLAERPELVANFTKRIRAFYKNGGIGVKGKHWKIPKESVERRLKFKGDEKAYQKIHRWVHTNLGKPSKCENCGVLGTGHKMNWANKSQQYKKEKSDWMQLCPTCHVNYDLNNIKI